MDIREFQAHMWALFRSITLGMDSSLRPIIESHGVTMTQMRILIEVYQRGELTVGEISQAIGSAPGNSSAMCKTLEKKGLVSRNRSLEDERIVLIAITPAGSTLLKLIEGELSSKFDPTLEQFSAEDFEEIISGMEKLRKVVNSLHDAFETNQARR